MHRRFKMSKAIIVVPMLLALTFIIACGGAAAPAVPATAVPATAVPTTAVSAPTPTAMAAPIATPKPAAQFTSIKPDPAAKYGGVLLTATKNAPGSWDVNHSPSSSVLSPVGPRLEGLMRMSPFDQGLTLVASLAKSWDVSDDGLLITFHLRDAKFHDGSTVTADDVAASWTRIHLPGEDEISYRQDWFRRLEEVKVLDASTVQFVFREQSAEIMRFIASDWNAVFPKKVLEANNNDLSREVFAPSAGPFKMAELKAGELIRYERFEDYWNEGLPYLDGIEINIMGAGAFAAFLVGQLDTIQVNAPPDFQLALDKGILGERAWVPIVGAIYFNQLVQPFDDIRIRRAMDLTFDKEDVLVVMADRSFVSMGRWSAPGGPWAQPEADLMALPAYNRDKDARLAQAKALMAEAGYPDGFSAKMTIGSPATQVAAAEYGQAVWKDTLNIDLDLEVLDWSVWIARAKKSQFGITSGAAFTTLHDPSDFMNVFWRTGGAQNWTGWSNAEFDSIMDKVDTTLDPTKRREFVFQAYDVLERDLPQISLRWTQDGHMWWPHVKGFPSRGALLGRYVYYDRQTIWLDR